jgi:hypothetical protein
MQKGSLMLRALNQLIRLRGMGIGIKFGGGFLESIFAPAHRVLSFPIGATSLSLGCPELIAPAR